MQKLKKPLSIKIIFHITNISFWLNVVMSIVFLGMSIVLIFNILDNDMGLSVEVPASIDIVEKGKLIINDIETKVEFVKMSGNIKFLSMPKTIQRIYGLFLILISLLGFYIFFTFKKFITNVYNGIYFEINNIALLKKISYALVGVWGFILLFSNYQYFYLLQKIEFDSIIINSSIIINPEILVIALLIWVLSHIFMKGCKLQEENNYTI